ncbi:hypothetical protein K4K53_006062 [Colletotrichum sp. SAR 10_77]|nr:hypothetical protein K4K52_005926 [Colletotrichum sp. SAR 10_76]KAI8226634.1 hypothetical protein K4K53_006062 [Colletotrichum sp. SAR 10_77]
MSRRPVSHRRDRNESSADWIARLRHVDEDAGENDSAFYRLMADIEEESLQAIGFRFHAKKTQNAQDRILAKYREFVVYLEGLPEDMDEDALDAACFPPPNPAHNAGRYRWAALFRLVRCFLAFVVRDAAPRSIRDENVSYTCLISYRNVLTFWVARIYDQRGEEAPRSSDLFNWITEIMRHLSAEFGLTRKRNKPGRSYIGVEELRLLIDEDTRLCASIELSEQHVLAWLLGRYGALRPGSLGAPEEAHRVDSMSSGVQYLAWKDVKISRSSVKGGFDVKLVIRNLKTNVEDPGKKFLGNKSLTFVIKSPQEQSNLSLSVPHRFLVILLRRGYLTDYETISDLLNGRHKHIRIKAQQLESPVFIAGTARGLGIRDDDTPLTSHALTEYIRRRGDQMGFELPVTFYSIRRQAGTEFSQILGENLAREIMSHDPDSRTLERFYVDKLRTTDVAAVALGEAKDARQSEMRDDEWSHLAITRLSPQKVAELMHEELDAHVRRSILQSQKYVNANSQATRKLIERRFRRRALRELVDAAHEEQHRVATLDEHAFSKEEIFRRATAFNKKLADMAGIDLSPDSAQLDDDSEQDVEGIDFDKSFGANAEANEPDNAPVDEHRVVEADAEILFNDSEEIEMPEEHGVRAEILDFGDITAKIPYEEAVEMSMRIMLDHATREHEVFGKRPCNLCVSDQSVTDREILNKTYTADKLKKHQQGRFHSRLGVFLREAKSRHEETGKWECPYCAEVIPEDETLFDHPNLGSIQTHCKRSKPGLIPAAKWSNADLAQSHYDLVEAAGWFEENFSGELEHKISTRKWRDADEERLLSKLPGFALSGIKELPHAIPVPGYEDNILYGGEGTFHRMEDRELGIAPATFPPPNLSWEKSLINENHMDVTSSANPGESGWVANHVNEVPDHQRWVVEQVPLPGTEGNLVGGGKRVRDKMEHNAQSKKARN